jgi:molybdenum cofactor biosynthesis protein B
VSLESHRAGEPRKLSFALLVTTDTRSESDDRTTPRVRTLVETAGHTLRECVRAPNDAERIVEQAQAWFARPNLDVVVVSGGTGFSTRDVSVDALRPLLTRDTPGFGELFRQLSFAEIGAAAMLSRAFAGAVGRHLMFVLPGSPQAVELAFVRLILPEAAHWLGQLRGEPGGGNRGGPR